MLDFFYINCYLNLKTFNIFYIAFIIKKEKRLFLKEKAIYLLIIKDILEKNTKYKLVNLSKLNINIIFKMA